ncbi:MAG: rhodanese-like domain-containing protein [Acidobacteriota bacterium]
MSKKLSSRCSRFSNRDLVLGVAAAIFLLGSACAFSATNPWSQKQLLQPATLARELQNSGSKPLLLHVGFESLYVQGHIPGSKYCGPARSPEGIANLKSCLRGVPHTRSIVLYCGCCPWQECPNIRPAFKTLKAMGFSNVKVLYIPDNFGRDWAQKGYPVSTGR